MAKYEVKCTVCGCEFNVNLCGPHKQREWKLEHTEWMCEECYQKKQEEKRVELEREHQRQNEQSAQANAQRNLPALQGTPKQVAWAETLRAARMAELDQYAKAGKTKAGEKVFREIESQSSASWWIDNRNTTTERLMVEVYENLMTLEEKAGYYKELAEKHQSEMDKPGIRGNIARGYAEKAKEYAEKLNEQKSAEQEEEAGREEAKTVEVMEPEKTLHTEIAQVREIAETKTVEVYSERDERTRVELKGIGFAWNGQAWVMQSPLYEYASVYAASALLRNGFRVSATDDVRERMGDVMQTRFVLMNKDKSCFVLVWWDKTRDWYMEAKRLPKARWNRGIMLVPIEYASEVADFAMSNGFVLMPSARGAMSAQGECVERVSAPGISMPPEETPLAEANGKIADSLKDD